MVILGGLEIVAAGYLIHKHQQHKKERARLADEVAALEESQYRIFESPPTRPSSSVEHRRRRSNSRESSGRHSHERRERRDRNDRPHSTDAKYTPRPRRDSEGRPAKSQMSVPLPQQQPAIPVYHAQVPVPNITHPPPQQDPYTQQAHAAMRPPPPPAYNTIPTAIYTPPQDMKYGWTDDHTPPPPPQQDPDAPPTGWPAHWAQSQTPSALAPPQGGEPSRHGRRTRTRTPEPGSSRVRFDVPRSRSSVRSSSRSPPPSYRS